METNNLELEKSEENKEQPQQSKQKFLKNLFFVLFSNALTVLSGTLVGFVIPKIMGITDYGYYKTFTLYSSYIGLFHFGFIDGIYLYFAGRRYESLDKEKFRTYTRFLFFIEFIVTIIALGISLCFLSTGNALVFVLVALNILALNMTTYFEFISQITMRFKQLSFRSIVKCVLTIISVVTLFLMYKYLEYKVGYIVYISIILGINYLLALWYIFSYKEIVFGKSNKIREELPIIKKFFVVGIPLLIANLIGQLIFLIDQQFVNLLFDKDTFGLYAFAYNLVSLVSIATSAISTVLYPTLRQMNNETIKAKYSVINSYLLIFVTLCLIIYFPLDLFVRNVLEEYTGSLDTFKIIFPGIVISSSITVIKYNCYKTFGLIKNYFCKSLFILALAVVLNTIVYFIFKTTNAISVVSIVVLLVWYLVVEFYFIKHYNIKWVKNLIYLLLMISSFYLVTLIENIIISGSIFLVIWVLITGILYFKELKNLKKTFRRS